MNNHKINLLNYLAGIIDGEGTIRIKKQKPRKRHNKGFYYFGLVSCGMTDKRPLILLMKTFGGKIYERKRSNRKPSWDWIVVCNQAINCCKKLLPYLIIKKERAKICLKLDLHKIQTKGREKIQEKNKFREKLFQQQNG